METLVGSTGFVSIHAPTGGATLRLGVCLWRKRFQFTRPRGARPIAIITIDHGIVVSIHAPTGGATYYS